MKNFIRQQARPLFYGTWFLLHLLQALFTELQDDEAYYWVYARFLDWGYFDHPPMVALLIKAGGAFFGRELGVRFFFVVLNTATLFLAETLTTGKDRLLFYAICLSAAVLQLIGFWAVPDVPLLFFTALFFWCYRRFLQQPSPAGILLLALACALLLYTKYHGVLIIFFTLLSNLRLLRRWPIYAVGILALLLFLPHLWWQYQHDWISFRYHLFESNVNRYKFSYTTDYLAGQLLIAGPIAGFILLGATFKYTTRNSLEAALKFTAIGLFLFFFLSSFKGKVEANWTAPAIIPMLVLTHAFLQEKAGWRKWLYRLLPVTLVLVIFARLIMVFDVVPARAVVQRFHAWKGWPAQVAARTGGLPLVFNNSYQRASKIWFYTGKPAYSLNSYRERRNNYNFWPVEDALLGRPAYILDIHNVHRFTDSIQARLWKVGYTYDSSFQAFSRVVLQPGEGTYRVKENGLLQLTLEVQMPEYYATFLRNHPEVNPPLRIGVFQNREWVKDLETPLRLQQLVGRRPVVLTVRPLLNKGTYSLRMAIGTSTEAFTHNSDKIPLEVD